MKRWLRNRKKVLRILGEICDTCKSKENLTIHHKIYVSQGGTNNIGNLQVLCSHCHKKIHQYYERSDICLYDKERYTENDFYDYSQNPLSKFF